MCINQFLLSCGFHLNPHDWCCSSGNLCTTIHFDSLWLCALWEQNLYANHSYAWIECCRELCCVWSTNTDQLDQPKDNAEKNEWDHERTKKEKQKQKSVLQQHWHRIGWSRRKKAWINLCILLHGRWTWTLDRCVLCLCTVYVCDVWAVFLSGCGYEGKCLYFRVEKCGSWRDCSISNNDTWYFRIISGEGWRREKREKRGERRETKEDGESVCVRRIGYCIGSLNRIYK